MHKKWCCAAALFVGTLLVACIYTKPVKKVSDVLATYQRDVDQVSAETQLLIRLIQRNPGIQPLQAQFKKARTAYKKIEWFAEYYYPYTAKKINGPALPEVEPDEKNIVIEPEGFQVMEEMLFAPDKQYDQPALLQQAKVLHSNSGRLRYLASIQETTDAHIFDALRLEIFRIIALGITGFDSPVANNSLPEAAAALKSVQNYLSMYGEQLNDKNHQLSEKLNMAFKGAIRSLDSSKNVAAFDRMQLITRYLNPISKNICLARQALSIPVFKEPRFLRADATTLFAENIFNPDYYTPNTQSYSNPDKVELGRKLFYDGILSGDGKRSCATCHQPEKAFTDGLASSFAFNGKSSVRRNAPTLINAALQPSLFYDMRVNYLEDQAKDVISNEDEMHGSLEDALKYINRNAGYRKMFENVYGNATVTELHIRNSLAAYVRSLTALNSRFDRYMRGDHSAMDQTALDGFNLFAGKAKCGTCHFMPLFNGSNPPAFEKTDAEIIGVPETADSLHPALDDDKGKYYLHLIALQKNAFKTPTLRNITLTAPYMHNGVFSTLEEVVEFYNRGGGAGLGLTLENQTLPADRLNLSRYEKKSLVEFMKALSDTTISQYQKVDIKYSQHFPER